MVVGPMIRRGGRSSKIARQNLLAETDPFLTRAIPTMELLSDEGLSAIEENAETLLEEIGIDFCGDTEVLALWRQAGADVQGERVRFPKGLVRELCQTAPSEFTYHARNPARSVTIGGKNTVFAPVHGAPFSHDLERGRRYGTLADCYDLVRLAQSSSVLHHVGGIGVEPVDIPVETRHLDIVYGVLRYADKPFMGSVTAPERAEDSIAMAKIVFGDEFVNENTVIMGALNSNSPLVWDDTMLGALKVYASAGQALLLTPFTLAGASSPVTIAGTATQVFAEASVGIALTQLVRKGAPVILGNFGTPIDMKSGAPTFGGAEAALLQSVAGQLARRLNVPFRSAGAFTASKVADAQSGMEAVLSLLPSVLSGSNFMLHCAGWAEGGLTVSYEKFIMDEDLLGAMTVYAKNVGVDTGALALDAFREVGPASHFLGCGHTQERYLTAFQERKTADNNSFEQWEAEGGKDAAQRAHAIWKERLANYTLPHMDGDVHEGLLEYIKLRKNEIGQGGSHDFVKL